MYTDPLDYYYDHFDEINGVVLINDLAYRHFNLINASKKRLAFTKDPLMMYTPVFYFHKQSVLRDIFNDELHNIREAGLTEYWIKQYVDDRKANLNQGTPTKLQIIHIIAVFKVCSTMYAISFIVFILEIISVKNRCIRWFLDYLTF